MDYVSRLSKEEQQDQHAPWNNMDDGVPPGVGRSTPQSRRHLNDRDARRKRLGPLHGRLTETDDLRFEPEPGTSPPQPSLVSGKRSPPSDDTHPLDAPLSKRPRRKIVKTRKAREADGMSPELDDGIAPGHAFPHQHLNWRVKDLESVRLGKDGSIQCTVILGANGSCKG
jgi:hypothetical protein